MKNWADRREFLKLSFAAGAFALAARTSTGPAIAQAEAKITEVDAARVWVLTDNYYDSLRPDSKITKRYRAAPGRSMHAEHGVAFYVETVVNGKASACMFDYGLDAGGVLKNIDALGLNVGNVAAFALSHGHFDHWSGAATVLKQNRSKIAAGSPFYLGDESLAHRFGRAPGMSEPVDLGQLRKEDLEAHGVRVVEVKAPTQIVPGAYLTGSIDRVTSYEKVPPSLLIQRGDRLEPDDFRGEQGLFFSVKGRGLVVLTGCGHVGVVNTVKQVQKIAGMDRLYAVMGGLHLANARSEIIEQTVADLKGMKPDYVVPAHCTGFEAVVTFNREMPAQFILNTAGTQYTFGA